jgi:hypothetical protein
MIKPMFICVCLSVVFAAACGDDAKGGTGPAPDGGQAGASNGNLPPCSEVCTDVIAQQCPSGPPTQADCVSGCETIRTGKCRDQYMALFACAGTNPSYTCNAGGFVQVVGCEAADSALNTCLSTP